MNHWFQKNNITNEKDRQVAHIISILIFVTWAAYFIVFFCGLYYGDRRMIFSTLAEIVILAIPFWLLKRSQLTSSSLLIFTSALGTLTLLATFGQGYRDASIFAFPIILVFTSMTLSRPLFFISVGLMLLSISWLVFGQMNGWYVPLPVTSGSYGVHYLLLVVIILVSAFAIDVLVRNMRKNLARAENVIAQLKVSDKKLRESEAKYRNLYNDAAIGIFHSTAEGKFLDVNPALAKLLGYNSPEEVVKCITNIAEQVYTVPPRRDAVAAKALEAGGIVITENSYQRKDGTLWDGMLHLRIVNNNDGKFNFYEGFVEDITERKQAAQEREKLNQQIYQMQKLESLGLLAGGIAHDFNNLMGGIFGYIDLARRESGKNLSGEYLSKASDTIDRARALTMQLLTFAKGGSPIKKIGSLFPFVQETALFALSGSTVSCTFETPKDLALCDFDKNQIGQVVDNIVINAKQAMPDGGTIKVTARNIGIAKNEHPPLLNGNYVELSIKDSGIGMPKEILPRIFDPFYTTKATGHGLGLASCYSIVNRHGGCIEVESEPGKGSTFHIFLPAASDSALSSSSNTDSIHKGCGVFLVMDDQELIRDTIGKMLGSLGYTPVCKKNGKEAIDFVLTETKANRKITAMIFDLTVPGGMGGKEAIAQIRKFDVCAKTPVFVTSGYAEDPVMANPAEHGFTASICKPFTISELSEMLNNYMKTNKREA